MFKNLNPLFLGLTHIGQIFALGWSKKIGNCSVYDFNILNLNKFKKSNFTAEERSLENFKYNKKKIKICKNLNELKKYSNIFFTYDTPINYEGKPDLNYIELNLKKLFSIKFEKKVNIFFTSQVYPGFTNYIKNKYLKNKKNIELIYMVDTLKMGNALNRFLKPEQLVFGAENKDSTLFISLFKKFKCKKYIYSYKEAETLKISINLFLYFSVNFANILDNYSKQIGVNFNKILPNLKNDKRIGQSSYTHPCPGISGGHLERDAFYIKTKQNNKTSKKIFENLNNFNNSLKLDLKKKIFNLVKKKKINLLIIGISYKENSFSLVNSIFKYILKSKKIKCMFYDSFFTKIKIKKLLKTKNLKFGIKKSDVIIYNYSNKEDLNYIIKIFKKKHINKFLINLSSKQRIFLSKENIINYY